MKVVAVTLARFAAFLEVQGLDPKGRTSTLRSLQALGKYSFAKVPQTFQELDFERGIELTDVDWSPFLKQTVRTHFSLNGELSHGIVTQAVHAGV